MWMSDVSMLAFQVNGLVDDGERVSLDEMRDAIGDGRGVQFLEEQYPERIDMGLQRERDVISEINEALESYNHATETSDLNIENDGLCYVVAVLLDVMQQGDRWEWGPSHDNPPAEETVES